MSVSQGGVEVETCGVPEPISAAGSVAAVRWAVFRMWPPDNPAFSVRRELALLLLDDPDFRLRVSHAELLLNAKPACSATPVCLQKLLSEPDCMPYFMVDRGCNTEWSSKVLKLNTQEILKQTHQRLDRTASPAAAADLDSELACAIASAWGAYQTDDDDYFAVIIAWIVATKTDNKAQLAQYSLHMTDVGGHLRALANTDERLAAIFPRAHHVRVGKPRPRLSEFLTQPRYATYFSLYDSTVRKSEKVVVLRVDKLMADKPGDAVTTAVPGLDLLALSGSPTSMEQLPQYLFEFEHVDGCHGSIAAASDANCGGLFALPSSAHTGTSAALQLDPVVEPLAGCTHGFELSTSPVGASRVSRGLLATKPTPASSSVVTPDVSAQSPFLRTIAPLPAAQAMPVTPRAFHKEWPAGGSLGNAGGSSREGSLSSSLAHAFTDGHHSFFGAPLFGPPVALVPDSIASCWSMDTKLDSASSFGQSPCTGLLAARMHATALGQVDRASSSTSTASSTILDQHAAAAEQLLLSSEDICMPGWSLSADDDASPDNSRWDEDSAGEGCAAAGMHGNSLAEELAARPVPMAKLAGGAAAHSESSFAPCTPAMLTTSPATATPVISQENSSSTDADTEDGVFHFTVGDSDDSPLTGTTPCSGTTLNPTLTGYAAAAARKPIASGSLGSPIPVESAATANPASWPSPGLGPCSAPTASTVLSKSATSWANAVVTGKPAPLPKPAGEEAGDGCGKGKAATNGPGLQDVAKLFPKLSLKVRKEILSLVQNCAGVKLEDFDDGVVFQLNQRSEEEALAALHSIATHDLTNIQHMAAFINFVIKNSHQSTTGVSSLPPGMQGGGSGALRSNAAPVSSKAIFQKLPIKVYRRLEAVIQKCQFLEWKHFDAGVIKVLAQLARIAEDDVLVELDTLQHSDLSSVEYMPAYLNKRLNNRLWTRRKTPDQPA